MDTWELVDRHQSNTWHWTESLKAKLVQAGERPYHPRTRYADSELIEAFGSVEPGPEQLLLHYAGPPFPAALTAPVLLVPGATKPGYFYWDPQENGTRHGLAQRLRHRGCHVYALTFSHSQDDNFIWADQIGAAIDRICALHGVDQVDCVTHSKSGVAARILACDLHRPYRGQLRRLLLVGVPNGGVDYFFRHPEFNLNLMRDDDNPLLNWPMSWDEVKLANSWSDWRHQAYDSGFWPGQSQLLARWDRRHPLPDEGVDVQSTYHGGEGEQSRSRGIDFFIEYGGRLIDRLAEQPTHSDIEVGVLAGASPSMPLIKNDRTGPGDGIVTIESAAALPAGSRLTALAVLPLHHKALIADPLGQEWICRFLLSGPKPGLTRPERERLLAQGVELGRRKLVKV
ncbi:MAG: esterase/lipase family protein [Vulcanimicrobiota bacterium]